MQILSIRGENIASLAKPFEIRLDEGPLASAGLFAITGETGAGSRGALAGTLFIDEGFGSLDAESLDLAIDALEQLQAQGRTIGVISHVQAMKDRIPVQLEVTKTGGGASEVALRLA